MAAFCSVNRLASGESSSILQVQFNSPMSREAESFRRISTRTCWSTAPKSCRLGATTSRSDGPPPRQRAQRPVSERSTHISGQIRAGEIAGTSGLVFPSLGGSRLTAHRSRSSSASRAPRASSTDSGVPSGIGLRRRAWTALAHAVGGVEGAYLRSDLFARRREVMQGWSDYLGRRGAADLWPLMRWNFPKPSGLRTGACSAPRYLDRERERRGVRQRGRPNSVADPMALRKGPHQVDEPALGERCDNDLIHEPQ